MEVKIFWRKGSKFLKSGIVRADTMDGRNDQNQDVICMYFKGMFSGEF